MSAGVPRGILLRLVLTTLFWGGTFIAGRFLAQTMPHFVAATLRFCFALVGLLVYAWGSGRRIVWPERWQWVVMLALVPAAFLPITQASLQGSGRFRQAARR